MRKEGCVKRNAALVAATLVVVLGVVTFSVGAVTLCGVLIFGDVVRDVISCSTAIPEFDAVVLFEGGIEEDFRDKVVARAVLGFLVQ